MRSWHVAGVTCLLCAESRDYSYSRGASGDQRIHRKMNNRVCVSARSGAGEDCDTKCAQFMHTNQCAHNDLLPQVRTLCAHFVFCTPLRIPTCALPSLHVRVQSLRGIHIGIALLVCAPGHPFAAVSFVLSSAVDMASTGTSRGECRGG